MTSSNVVSPACNAPLILAVSAVIVVVDATAFAETVPLAVTSAHSIFPVAVMFPAVVISSVAVIPFCTVKSPVIVTSHKYQANAEKSPVISVPLDNTKV